MIRNVSGEPGPHTATVVGYHGYQNLGDDIFRRLVLQWLNRSLKIDTCYISTKDDTTEYLDAQMSVIPFSTPITRISRLLWLNVFKKSLGSNALIFSAGSIFTIQPFLLIYLVLRLLRLFRGQKLKILALGVSVGPFHNRRDRYWCLKGLSLMDYVIVRDSQSQLLLDEAKQPTNAKLSFDLALCWKKTPATPKVAGRAPMLGLAITERALDLCTATHSVNCTTMLQILEDTLTKFNEIQIRVLCVCNDERDGDRLISQHLHEILSKKWQNRVELIYYEKDNVEEMLTLIAECSALVSARMHAGIMGMLASVPVYQISYAEKIQNFYRHSELSTQYLADHTTLNPQSISEFISMSITGQLQSFASAQRTILEEKGKLVSQELEELAKKLALDRL